MNVSHPRFNKKTTCIACQVFWLVVFPVLLALGLWAGWQIVDVIRGWLA